TATIDFSTTRGAPKQYGSGILYGIPDTDAWQIPKHFFTDIGINHGRGGGSQVPGKGWVGGEADYVARIKSVHSNYLKLRELGGNFFMLNSGLWGGDGLLVASDPLPGDNDDWSSYDAFLLRVAADINSLGMTQGLIVELWNEADYSAFWLNRSKEQWLKAWGWAYHRLRPLLPASVIIGGPAFATEMSNAGWWPDFFQYVKTNGSVPEYWSYHCLFQAGGIGNDPEWSIAQMNGLLTQYGLPTGSPLSINEYAPPEDQNPGYSAWVISTFERRDVYGLRANWAAGGALHDYMASLVGKPDDTNGGTYSNSSGGYWPTGEWHLYKYYKQSQTGVRVASERSVDDYFDVFATWDASKRKASVIAGTNAVTGTYDIQVNGLPAGAFSRGRARVVVKKYPWVSFRAQVTEAQIVTVSDTVYTVTGGAFTIPLTITEATSGYSLDITPA
ncbi:hypothetical protein P167DRAFT_494778, partial [Morchella conica CCBAS932]